MKIRKHISLFVLMAFFLIISNSAAMNSSQDGKKDQVFKEYVDFLEKVYETMQAHYYHPVSREIFNQFIQDFSQKIYPQFKQLKKTDNYVRWRSSDLLVKRLKTQEDIFSSFYPPKPAKEYKESVLAQRIDLGIEGQIVEQGFKTTQVEPRSDAYEKGLRIGDILIKIDKGDILSFSQEKIMELLTPVQGTKVHLDFLTIKDQSFHAIDVMSKEYFKQTVFPIPTKVPGIYGLEIRHFNRTTGEDIFRFMQFFKQNGEIKGLILDLRNNPGGPPLAARELSAFFLKGGEDFAYFQKRGEPKALLDVPKLPREYHYDGPIVILVNKKSGSASELFSGTMQRRGRAVIMGENTAGQVMLKSMFPFEDKSMVVLIVSRGYYADGAVFSFDGIVPNKSFKPEETKDLVDYATLYLAYTNKQKKMSQ